MLGLLGREEALHPENRVSRPDDALTVIRFINEILILKGMGV
jgi:hypothetical protein